MKYEDNQYYHVYNRGTNKGTLFYDHENYLHCLKLIKKYKSKYGVTIIAYCLMPNHYHLVLRQSENGLISRFLQTSFNAYVQALNKEVQRSGTLFESRAKGILIDSDRYLFQVIRYVHLNPVLSGLVEKAENWEFSDYRTWIGQNEPTMTDLELRNEHFENGEEYKLSVEEFRIEQMKDELLKYLID